MTRPFQDRIRFAVYLPWRGLRPGLPGRLVMAAMRMAAVAASGIRIIRVLLWLRFTNTPRNY